MKLKLWHLAAFLLLLILGLVFLFLMPQRCKIEPNPPRPGQITELPPDTVHVHHWHTDKIEIKKIVPVIDTMWVAVPSDSSFSVVPGYVATMDTTHIISTGEIYTRVTFYHPQQLFDFVQETKIRSDTTYVYKTKIVNQQVEKHRWEYTAIGICAGVLTGITIGLLVK